MFYSPKLFFRDVWVWVPLMLVIMIQSFLWWSMLTSIRRDTDTIFLHYNIIFGVDLVGKWWRIFYLPLMGIGVLMINYFLAAAVYLFDKFLARFLTFWVLFFHLFLTVGIFLLVRLNS